MRKFPSSGLIMNGFVLLLICLATCPGLFAQATEPATKPRTRDIGITVGVLPTGTLNAISDVPGVLVGHTTIIRGEEIRTGVTAIVPHGGN